MVIWGPYHKTFYDLVYLSKFHSMGVLGGVLNTSLYAFVRLVTNTLAYYNMESISAIKFF